MKNAQSQDFTIARDCARHAPSIARVTLAAFEKRYGSGKAEVAIIEALRRDGDVVVELAALEDGEVLGHVMFSRAMADPPLCRTAALAPVAVHVDRQSGGIGSSLIRAGLATCAGEGIEAIVVLGDPHYYGRFGFRADLARGLACVYAGPHFQALELRAGALAGVASVAYARAFQSPAL